MNPEVNILYSSVTRIASLEPWPLEYRILPRDGWERGYYVVTEVLPYDMVNDMEIVTDRDVPVGEGDLVVGALGTRYATLEVVGDFRAVEDDGFMHVLSGGGLLGRMTSRSMVVGPPAPVRYLGHVLRGGEKLCMHSLVEPRPEARLEMPAVLVTGTSMSAGKTFSARVLVRQLRSLGHRVVGAKLAGAGRHRDALALKDAGAEATFDFVDGGLPSTICPVDVFRGAVGAVIARMNETGADVSVVEVGASPLEPYNGGTAVEMLGGAVRCTILCASDPYAVRGIIEAWGGHRPDVVAGPTANTEAGVQLVKRLTGIGALNLMRRETLPALREVLMKRLSA